MAQNLVTRYGAGRTTPADADYPLGAFKNEVTPGVSNDGTPNEKDWINNIWGFYLSILEEGDITESGDVDTALASDALDGLHAIFDTPSGTTMLFVQASAPVGWTKSVTHNNKALRIVNTAGAGTGGSNTFTSALNTSHSHTVTVNSHALTTSEMPAHTHDVHSKGYTGEAQNYGHTVTTTLSSGGTQTNTSGNTSGAALTKGGGSGHSHTGSGGGTNLNVQYVDAIICVKD